MKKITLGFLLIILALAASGAAQSKKRNIERKTTKTTSTIRKIDFKNFNYGQLCGGYHKFLPIEKSDRLVLRKGHAEFGDESNYADLGSVKYVDFDGDGQEEAFVIINGQTSGSSNDYLATYVFAYQNGKPKQIWTKCEENSAAELKSRTILFTYPEWIGDAAHCCPTYFTTDSYAWKGAGLARIARKRKKAS
ncbi:MAG TPA: hypothetical protein VGC76_00780 [Pyrinomonadaceae bacterium]|jgi:hypothetical protein